MIISIEDVKVYVANVFTFTVSMTSIDMVFKTLLFLATFGYTIHQWILMVRKNKYYGKSKYGSTEESKEQSNS
jgi:hypothetical protein